MIININIKELSLQGFDFHDHPRITTSMKQELTRLFVNSPLETKNLRHANIPLIDNINLKTMTPHAVGRQIAHSIFDNITKSKNDQI